jgi:hypothetical protein
VKTITAIAAHKLGNLLTRDFGRIFGSIHDDDAERLGSAARATIECPARSDALYHNYEHTLQVTMVGCDILHGIVMSRRIEPADYIRIRTAGKSTEHRRCACRGSNRDDTFSQSRRLPSGRAKASSRNWSRPPISLASSAIPSRKANARYWEFEEIGMNRQLGYSSPVDIIEKYPSFFWNCVSMHLDDGIKFLNMTASGRQWIANLHHHILCAERAQRLMGPQG